MRNLSPLLRQATLDPYQILALPRSASSSEIKTAYYSLVKTHHPDLPSSSKPKNFDFKDIVSSYELLRDPKKREAYLRYGLGWASDGRHNGATAYPEAGFNYNNVHNPWGSPKARRHKHAHERPRYPSSSWDFGHSDTTDFYSSNVNSAASSSRTSEQYTSNASFIAILAAMSALLYSVQFWILAPIQPLSSSTSNMNSLVGGDPKDAPIYRQSTMMRGRDRHHEDASRALGAAREAAQKWGSVRRDSIRFACKTAYLALHAHNMLADVA